MEYPVQFPDPMKADDEGLVAVGGELSPQYLLSAYAQGVFPWFNESDPLLWWSPNPRMVLLPVDFKVSKSLLKVIRSGKYEVRIDTCFSDVIKNCGSIKRKDQDGTWITDEMQQAYIEIHNLGFAHSFETFKDNKLVGGLYGISLGKAFFGESMFYADPNASKIAFYQLVDWCKRNGFHFIDAQQSTSHLKSLGAKDVPRKTFLEMLNKTLNYETIQGKWSSNFKP